MKRNIPPPGSDEAIKQGCTCPVLDNNHGKGILWEGKICWWRNGECPLHGHKSEEKKC